MVDTGKSFSLESYARVLVDLMRGLAGLRRQVGRDLGQVALLETASVAFGVIGPYALKVLVDGFGGSPIRAGEGVLWAGLFVLAWSGAGIFAAWRLLPSTRVIDRLASHLVSDCLMSELPRAATTRDRNSGQLLGLLERLNYSLVIVVDGLLWRTLPLLLQVLVSLWLMATLIPLSYAVALCLLLVGHAGLSAWAALKHQGQAEAANAAAAQVSGLVGDLLRNARRVVFNGAVAMEMGNVRAAWLDKTRANRAMVKSLFAGAAAQYGWLGVGLTALLIAGLTDVAAGRLTTGEFIMLETYALRLAVPLSAIGFILSQSASAVGTVREVLARMERTGGARSDPGDMPAMGPASLQLAEVSFTYPGSKSGLKTLSLEVPAGSFTVIVGPNGAGKSTLAQLLAGVLVPDRGTVGVNGRDIHTIAASDRHRWVLYVPQFISMLNRPLRDNALYPPTRLTESELTDLLVRWRFYPEGYPPSLHLAAGESAERLSGGQVQKLELARLSGIDVPALILDESTSALDPQSEAAVMADLLAHLRGRTTLVMVTHRPAIVSMADQVINLPG